MATKHQYKKGDLVRKIAWEPGGPCRSRVPTGTIGEVGEVTEMEGGIWVKWDPHILPAGITEYMSGIDDFLLPPEVEPHVLHLPDFSPTLGAALKTPLALETALKIPLEKLFERGDIVVKVEYLGLPRHSPTSYSRILPGTKGRISLVNPETLDVEWEECRLPEGAVLTPLRDFIVWPEEIAIVSRIDFPLHSPPNPIDHLMRELLLAK